MSVIAVPTLNICDLSALTCYIFTPGQEIIHNQ